MKTIIPTFLFILLSIVNFAQKTSISGQVLDQESAEAIEYASVALYQLPDSSLIAGVITDLNGKFSLKETCKGTLYCEIQFLGYQSYRSATFQAGQNIDLGTIRLGLNTNNLNEVEVRGREITSLYKLNKQVFQAKQFQNAQGGNATDVLRNLPSITVDANGEISVRGTTGFIVMLNGKPVQTDPSVVLNQIAANSIDDIEIITAPSAKYDPDGKAGIINIKTRQGALDGLFVLFNTQIGLPSIEPYDNAGTARRGNADLTVNYKKGRWDWSFGADYRRNDVSGRRVGYVNTYQNDILTEFPSFGERSFDRENYTGRISMNYQVNEKQSLGTAFYAGKRTQFRTADILYDQQRRSRIPTTDFLGTEAYWDLYQTNNTVFNGGALVNQITYFNANLRVRRGDFLIGALDYDFSIGENSQLKLSALYERTILGGPTDNINTDFPNTQDTLQLQFNTNDNPLDGFRFQADFSSKIGALDFESGYQFRYLQHPGDFIYLDKNFETKEFEENSLFTNSIELRRGIHAIYGQVSGQQGKLSYTAGLRLEYFNREVDIEVPANTFTLEQINPFPSLNLQYDLGNEFFLNGAYSRRIQRTTTFKMTPFPEREHSETLEQGDAELNPEFVDLIEVGASKSWGDHNLSATLYYRNVDDVINRVNTIFNDTILNRIYTNAGDARALGLEIGTTFYPNDKWRFYLGGNVYNYRIQGQLFGDEIDTDNTIYSINANTNYDFSPSFSGQLAFNYLSRRVTAQGEDSRFYNPSLTLRKTFMDKRLAVTLQWLNIDMGLLESNEQRITTVRDNFFTTTNYIYEVDILMLGVSYQINQASKKTRLLKSEFGDKEF
ncbi:MAG: outer membrane beta-barrel family protein [Bacteroidota bacterium]